MSKALKRYWPDSGPILLVIHSQLSFLFHQVSSKTLFLSKSKCLLIQPLCAAHTGLPFIFSDELITSLLPLNKERRLNNHILLYTAQVQVLSAALRAAQFDSVGDCETKKMEESGDNPQNKMILDEATVSGAACNQVQGNTLSSPASQDDISDQSSTSVLKTTVSTHCAPCLSCVGLCSPWYN